MKKVAIICCANIKHMTLISLYTDLFKQCGQEFDIIYIDKYHQKENYDGAGKLYRFEITINQEWSFARKFIKYWKFKRYAIDTINKEKYDFLIIWNEFTGFMLESFLRKRYANRYCINIRDENYNHIPIVQYRYSRMIEKSCFNTISSERFKDIFPKADYLFVQSYNKSILDGIEPIRKKRNVADKIRIMFIGRMSYPHTMGRAIEVFANDDRFELLLIGEGCQVFNEKVVALNAHNIVLHGGFAPNETKEFLNQADIIYSLNKENDLHSDALLPIKLYYAVGRHIPIIAYRSSYTYEYANRYGIGIGISDAEFNSMGDIVYRNYCEMDQEIIDKGCLAALEDIMKSQKALESLIFKYIIEF